MKPFIYDKEIPEAILPVLMQSLEPWAWVVPAWCERVFVGYSVNSDPDNYSAKCQVEYPYRWARINFYPCFLGQEDMSHDALHEVIHISLAVVANYAREKIETLVPESEAPKFRQTLLDELRDRVESVTEDIASRILERENLIKSSVLASRKFEPIPAESGNNGVGERC